MEVTYSWADLEQTTVEASDGRFIPADPGNESYAALDPALIAPVPLARAKASVQARIFAARTARMNGHVLVGGQIYLADAEAQGLVQGAMLMALAMPGHVQPWKTADGQIVSLEQAGITALAAAMGQRVASLYATEQAKTAALGAAATLEDVLMVDVEADWPDFAQPEFGGSSGASSGGGA